MDAPNVANMTVAEKRQLLVDYWTKKPPVVPTPAGASSGTPVAQKTVVPAGPGTEQKLLLAGLGFDADAINEICKTGCADYAVQMDRWGVEGCKKRLHEIAGRLHDQAILQKARFRDSPVRWVNVAYRALRMGLILNPLNPYPGLVRECIRRAEVKTKEVKNAGD